jgi:hypothetical protein
MKFRPTFLTSVAALALMTGITNAQLADFGPLSEHGFPTYYTDIDGLSCEAGLDGTDVLLTAIAEVPLLPDPTGRLDVAAGNFYGEFFYWLGTTTMAVPGGNALCVMAVEGVFDNATEAIIDGDQLVFSRIRIRYDVTDDPANAGTYTVTTPFTTYVFEITAADIAATGGNRVINFTDDCLHLDITNPSCSVAAGNQFTNVNDPAIASISRFLPWDANVAPAAPAGYLGDPNIAHTISGSPTGNNLFRVQGPNGLDDSTDLFNIAAKTIVVEASAFLDLGNSLVGTNGEMVLSGTGDLSAGSPYTLDAVNGPISSTGLLLMSPTVGNTAFFGGIMVPDLANLGFRRPVGTNAAGEFHIAGNFPNGVPPGTEFNFQLWISDPGAVQGVAASNGLNAITP